MKNVVAEEVQINIDPNSNLGTERLFFRITANIDKQGELVNDLVVHLTAILTTRLPTSQQEDSCFNDELAGSPIEPDPTAVLSQQASSFTWFGSPRSYQDFQSRQGN